ncbi:hypothetical protein HMPREF2617_02835 [Corynebacterium sp. HMSC070H05]|uniref:SpaH/EbpB family LPXTG-anchored major pilin n=1 Tax=Corynebacterium sp. HMSC070H05 TaxID=1715096 RepID=UPI0008A98363|nr:SpaH/EbpB family LPXTG-anchored major pilin [Corynebacterium sp. HMSC070H05]OHQ51621.1 hypothetical protein HMPREF2617_02835 [Corynebacterium sp. HMSC070H05]
MAIAMKKTAAIAIAAGLTFAGSAGIAAQDALAQENAQVQTVNTDPYITGDTGKLTIHKRLNPAQTGKPTGNAEDKPAGTAVQGVKFNITKLDFDVKKQDDFNKAAKLTAAEAANLAKAKTPTEKTTDEKGEIVLDNQAVGVYYVEELASPEATVGGQKAEGLIPSPGFVVFLPMTNPLKSDAGEAQTRWNYDVHVYPKNTQSKTEKTVIDADKNVGDVVDYSITANIPGKTNNDKLDSFNIVDAYNNSELGDMKIKNVEIVDANGNVLETLDAGYALGPEVQYEAPKSGALPNTEGTKTVNVQRTISFSDLTKLEENRGQRVRVNLTATLKEIGEGDGDVANRARSFGRIGYGDGTTKPFDTPETEVVTYLGKLLVNKTNEESKALPGATFELYRCTPGENGAAAELDGKALKVNNATSWTTDDNGLITIDGLHVTDIENHTETIDKSYCLVETKAPAGYELLTQPVPFKLTVEDRNENEVRGTKVALSKQVDIQNNPTTTVKLPATGGMGVLVMALAGLAIIGGGVYAARRNSQSA